MNMLSAILLATGSALGAALLVLLVVKFATLRGWARHVEMCARQLKGLHEQFDQNADNLKRADAIGHEHLRWTLDALKSTWVDMETAKARGNLDDLIESIIRFRDGMSYFDGYFAAMHLLTSGNPNLLRRLEGETRRELHEAADRISRLGWSLDGSSVVRSAMQEMAGSLREASPAAPLDGLRSVAEALSKANRTLFAAMVESDISK